MFEVNDMGHRGRVVVQPDAPSDHILVVMPRGYERLGLVSVGSGDPGVFAKITRTGDFVMLDKNGTTPLDRRKVEAALDDAGDASRPVGRPRQSYERREVFSVSLEPSLAEYVRGIGSGNLSDGVSRLARSHRTRAMRSEQTAEVADATAAARVVFIDSKHRKNRNGDLEVWAIVDGTEDRTVTISREALEDYFGASSGQEADLVRSYISGKALIQRRAIPKLLASKRPVLLTTADFEGM